MDEDNEHYQVFIKNLVRVKMEYFFNFNYLSYS